MVSVWCHYDALSDAPLQDKVALLQLLSHRLAPTPLRVRLNRACAHFFVSDPKAPVLPGIQGALAIALVIGVAAQLLYLRKLRQAIALPD
jgi:hypothetical protein